MMTKSSWRERPTSRRRRFLMSVSLDEMLDREKYGRLKECYLFFADFWHSTPHPVGQMLLVVGWAMVVAVLNDTRVVGVGLQLDPTAGGALTTIVAFLIVFRTNQSYNRWWEGRILWGKMHWSCVELSQQAAGWIEDRRLARRIMYFAITFAYTVKQCLRREQLLAEDLEGIVEPAEVARMNRLPPVVMPYYCTDVMRQCIKKGLTDKPQAFGVQAVARGIDIPVSQLSVQYADMARVRNTPQPEVFRVMLHMFTIVYLLLLPIISYDAMGYWIIPEVFFTSYLMLGLQLAATYLEDPFGYDMSDLELDLYVANIESQCRAAFYLGEKGDVDLTLSDGGAGRDRDKGNDNDYDHGTEPTSSTENSLPASTSSPLHAIIGPPSGTQSDEGRAPFNAGPSPAFREPPLSAIEVAPSLSGELFAPQLFNGSGSERGRSAKSRNGGAERFRDQSGEVSGDQHNNNAVRIPPLKTLAIRHRTQEELAPRRRSKSRPGRGQSPIVKESLFASPQPPMQQYSFENQDAAVNADVV